ncbi:hypothetical protein EUTSA_v10009517mg [Eutrema salsugineum]|uniref:Bifunctional inhibitor/plant lipid transfer protein/seed storage helical domain-containing protein n=1 Tax=Eutrema salsugineum TaxID=72664 RepID=V4L4C5_EUTSA|nr:hypothetical protein EUTSA_v10009517mg [Eutrema salsugineum]
MSTQPLKKICGVLMIIALCVMMFSVQLSYSNTIDVSVKNCIPKCMKVAKNGTPDICEKLCEKLCLESPIGLNYIVPPSDNGHLIRFCRYFGLICDDN